MPETFCSPTSPQLDLDFLILAPGDKERICMALICSVIRFLQNFITGMFCTLVGKLPK